ncbi:hypothetical protein GCM10023115_04640 [Pontixanthobacter gangjinensis]|uniref:DUF1491 family protein n=1 Tax=Pontixanthobacter gangjinensis TaxID=1028742 RepID=A0A6I4SLM2_9SPHN|nr:DUF1491 family protein [Pontixanthobacter gangjinensis]MXO55717.1 DUF1491 family protein [Pontixanthobacter gangjinensis]
MDDRLPAHLEISGIIRAVQSQGGFATVLSKGERDAGTILLLMTERGKPDRLYERMPQLDGSRVFALTKTQDPEKPKEFEEYLTRRAQQDPDMWVLELDIADAERFAAVQHK